MPTFALSYVEPTPNPNAFKFHAGEQLLEKGNLSFSSLEEAEVLPIAKTLFELGNVTAVMVAEDFVSVSGTKAANWQKIRQTVEDELPNFDKESAKELASERAAEAVEANKERSADPLFNQVNDLIDMYVRPALAGDGGGVELLSVEDKIVTIRYQGACGSCPTSTASTLTAIESLIQDKVDPELRIVPG